MTYLGKGIEVHSHVLDFQAASPFKAWQRCRTQTTVCLYWSPLSPWPRCRWTSWGPPRFRFPGHWRGWPWSWRSPGPWWCHSPSCPPSCIFPSRKPAYWTCQRCACEQVQVLSDFLCNLQSVIKNMTMSIVMIKSCGRSHFFNIKAPVMTVIMWHFCSINRQLTCNGGGRVHTLTGSWHSPRPPGPKGHGAERPTPAVS